jgi:hypothetical protein
VSDSGFNTPGVLFRSGGLEGGLKGAGEAIDIFTGGCEFGAELLAEFAAFGKHVFAGHG